MIEPLRIEWELSAPMVISPHPLHLDGLLALAASRRFEVEEGLHWSAAGAKGKAQLPLDRWTCAGEWGWCASILLPFGASQPRMQTAIRKTEPDKIAADRSAGFVEVKRNKIPLGTGPLRNYDYRFVTREINSISAWCLGDYQEIEELVAWIDAIGPMTRNGWGAVKSVNIAKITGGNQWKQRHLPGESGGEGKVLMGGLRPPYWSRKDWRKVKMGCPDSVL